MFARRLFARTRSVARLHRDDSGVAMITVIMGFFVVALLAFLLMSNSERQMDDAFKAIKCLLQACGVRFTVERRDADDFARVPGDAIGITHQSADRVAIFQQARQQMATDKTVGTGNADFHEGLLVSGMIDPALLPLPETTASSTRSIWLACVSRL